MIFHIDHKIEFAISQNRFDVFISVIELAISPFHIEIEISIFKIEVSVFQL